MDATRELAEQSRKQGNQDLSTDAPFTKFGYGEARKRRDTNRKDAGSREDMWKRPAHVQKSVHSSKG